MQKKASTLGHGEMQSPLRVLVDVLTNVGRVSKDGNSSIMINAIA